MDRWTRGRVALVGDAAACVSLMAGEGTGLAILESYVLAGELRNAGTDVAAALARYEERLMPLLRAKQRFASRFAASFAPRTRAGIMFRNLTTRLLRIPPLADWAIGRSFRDALVLPRYDFG
jgi:2-polyprenyl-6-methoxyphenol hydroxylase-like FAD-dependent oxidoreductase